VLKRRVTTIDTGLVTTAIIQAVIEVDKTLLTADGSTCGISYQPGRGQRQASGQDCEHKNPTD
jgi:hypothetical protein